MKKVFTKARYLLALVSMVLMGTTVATAQTLVEAWSAGGTAPDAKTKLVDNEFVTVETVYATESKKESQAFWGHSFSYCIYLRTASDANAENPTGGDANPDKSGTPLIITAKQDVNVTFYYRRQKGNVGYIKDDNKDMLCYTQEGTEYKLEEDAFETEAENAPTDYIYAKKTYQFFAGGIYTMHRSSSTIQLYGFDVLNPKQVVNADIDCTGTITDGVLEGAVNKMIIGEGEGGAATEIVNNSYMKLGDHDNIVTIPEEELAGTRDIIEVSFDMAWGNKQGMGNGITIKDAGGETIAYFKYARWNSAPNENNLGIDDIYAIMGGHSGNIAVWNNKTHFVITIDYAQKTISTVATLGSTTKEYKAALTNTNPMESFVVYGYNADGNADRAGLFGNLVIKTTKGNYDVATAEYTVKWVGEDGNVVKEETREGDVGSEISLLPADLASFFEGEVKYIVKKDDAEGKTVDADGTTVVTISVRKAVKWAYTVTSSYDGNTLDWKATGEVWEDEPNVTISYPRYLASGTLLVEKKPNGNDLQTRIVVEEDGYTTNLDYEATAIDNLYFVSEAEDLNTGLSQSATSYTSRVSSGKIIYGATGELFKLPAGKYIVTLGVIGGTGSQIARYALFAGEKQILQEFTCSSNFLNFGISDEFIVESEEVAITFTGSNTNSDRGIDLVYVQKTGDIVPTTITSAGWATLYSDKALDFSGTGLTAYTATYEGERSVVVLNAVDKVPAETGVVLKGVKGEEKTFAIPVITEDVARIEDNDLGGSATEAVAWDAVPDYDLYILALSSDKSGVEFLKLGSGSSAAGKAYLKIPQTQATSGVRVFSVVFGDDTTGINEAIVNGEQKAAGTYNLNGQRVAQPTKGLYIVNGKKVIIK